eukprot:9681741-Alexandrium_andersonii.AAC.1
MEIFGDKERNLPGDAQLAADALMSFVEHYPDGKEKGAKRMGLLGPDPLRAREGPQSRRRRPVRCEQVGPGI